ncbi:molybdopterin molybdotransferase MoeA [Pontixanthobacter sp.]|uniref:molybdopterin molybdotransferase MoeA n=1 Tax=Pontixanthobacter sp. TaxID=2792078 RepID=UPI003C7B64B1
MKPLATVPEPLSLHDAQKKLLALAATPGTQTVITAEANGRYLAQALAAQRTQPPTDLSSMDGYAISGSGPWRIIGESRCGKPFTGIVQHAQAVRISTGAAMPKGADRVLIQEDARTDGATIGALSSPPDRHYIRQTGFDFHTGDRILAAGTRIGPAQIALALSAGHGVLEVMRLPSLALIEGGDELVADPAQAGLSAIPASNNAMLTALCEGLTRKTDIIGPVEDTVSALGAALDAARNADIIVTSGGASVGDYDLVQPALKQFGAEIAFWRVAIKPGKPLLVAQRGRQIILGLPGNPVSSFTTAFLFLLPLLKQMAGSPSPMPQKLSATLADTLPPGGPRREFVRGIWDGSRVTPIAEQDSSALRALASANAFIERPENCGSATMGTDVPIYPF